MSTPYWGQLPSPRARRLSESSEWTDRRQSLDHSTLPQPRYSSNRASGQTTVSDVPTESTYTSFASPTNSNAPGGGLTPRPPSSSYTQDRRPPEPLEYTQTWRSRDPSDAYEFANTSTPPAAPDVPKAPPISYRDPYGNSGSLYTYKPTSRSGLPRPVYRPEPEEMVDEMESEPFYAAAVSPTERRSRQPAFNEGYQTSENGVVSPEHLERELARAGSIRRPSNAYQPNIGDTAAPKRRESLIPESQQKTWAADRSPLQKLELTLDSITKEEKRARVEAAERRARERAAQVSRSAKAPDYDEPPPGRRGDQQSRSRDKGQPMAGGQRRHTVTASQVQHIPSTAIVHDASQNLQEVDQRYGSSGQARRPQTSGPGPRDDSVTADGAPRRNLSFRDRAAAQDHEFLRGPDVHTSQVPPNTTLGRDFIPTRTSSNKLKKNPPGDPWYISRREAEERAATYGRVDPLERDSFASEQRSGAYAAAHTQGGMKNMSPAMEDLARPPARGKTFGDDRYEDERPSRMKGLAAVMRFGRSNSLGANRRPSLPNAAQNASIPSRQYTQYNNSDGLAHRRDEFGAPIELGRTNQTSQPRQASALSKGIQGAQPGERGTKSVKFQDREHEPEMFDDDMSDTTHQRHRLRDYLHHDGSKPEQTMFRAPTYLDEWKQGTVGILSGPLLDLSQKVASDPAPGLDKHLPWWETNTKRRPSVSAEPPSATILNVADDENDARTAFNPPLYLKCGPLLRYCGIRAERLTETMAPGNDIGEKEIWRGSVMIVTQDSDSSYDTAPILRLFVQPIELLPPPPAEIQGEQSLLPEYVDPIAGIPKIGRRGETLYVRPVDQLEEAKDLSMVEPDDGLFELTRSVPDDEAEVHDPPGSFPNRKKRIEVDGEKLGKYKDVRGFRLHTERGHTFWRFNIGIELRDKQQRIAYRINRGPAAAFWVPARGEAMNIMFHSCNGFSQSVNPDDFSGPDPMWRDVLNDHQTRPFHVMIGGGDQIYNDVVAHKAKLFREWIAIKNPLHKNNAPFGAAMQEELEAFYMERYMLWFSQGLFGLANSQIPMVNMYDDHDIIDGFGSYPHHFMKCPVFSGLGNVAFKYYMLFQHQSTPDETEESEPSWRLGEKPGPYINQLSRSLFMSLGAKVALLAVDTRTERTRDEVLRPATWRKLMDRCYDEIETGAIQHLLVLVGVPIAYPRLVWLENILTSRLMDPVKALGKAGLLGNFVNSFDGGVEVLDDLDDHWTAKNHKDERRLVIEDLQDLSADKSIRVTILSGDVHLAAVGQFFSNPKLRLPKHKDFRYMLNVVSSAIANTPPPDLMADVLNKRDKIHHFDKETDENMMPLFGHGIDGKPRNNKHLLPHRNWCSIRGYVPGHTPPPTPPLEEPEYTTDVAPNRGGLLRRLSLSKDRGPTIRPDVPREPIDRSRPPISGGFMRSFSRRGSSSDNLARPASKGLVRTLSLGSRPRSLFRRDSNKGRPDDGGINGSWGEDDDGAFVAPEPAMTRPFPASGNNLGLRGGASNEYELGDEAQFTARPVRRAFTQPSQTSVRNQQYNTISPNDSAVIRPFHRTPTGLSVKKLQKHGPERYEVDAEGALEVCLNVEVNPKDPAGITVPYRLLVPRLWYEESEPEADTGHIQQANEKQEEFGDYDDEHDVAEVPQKKPSVLRRLLSRRRKGAQRDTHEDEYEDEDDEDEWNNY